MILKCSNADFYIIIFKNILFNIYIYTLTIMPIQFIKYYIILINRINYKNYFFLKDTLGYLNYNYSYLSNQYFYILVAYNQLNNRVLIYN